MTTPEQSVATLVFPEDYLRQLNSVASVTTQNVVHLKRKFVSKAGWELVPIPLSEFTAIEYRRELALARVAFGAFLVALVLLVLAMLVKYWNDLEPSTRFPSAHSRLRACTVFGWPSVCGAIGSSSSGLTVRSCGGSRAPEMTSSCSRWSVS